MKKGKLKVYAGISLITIALVARMGLNVNENIEMRQVIINNDKKIETLRRPEVDKKKGKTR